MESKEETVRAQLTIQAEMEDLVVCWPAVLRVVLHDGQFGFVGGHRADELDGSFLPLAVNLLELSIVVLKVVPLKRCVEVVVIGPCLQRRRVRGVGMHGSGDK
eukprot:6068823-Pleurochrysis_carterae.AAC.1